MLPIGPLMIEHRLIERVIEDLGVELSRLRSGHAPDPSYLSTVIDFLRTYADRTHHGKEEDILFRDLAKKNMSDEDKRGMQELVDEHVFARKNVAELVQAKNDFVAGRKEALDIVLDRLKILVEFYPEHIRREDEVFFPDTERYFTKPELDAMLVEFWEFDKKMIHEKYKAVVEQWKQKIKI